MDKSTLGKIKKWYSGKALQVVETFVIPALIEALALGYWPKGVSRRFHGAINKTTVAAKFAKANEKLIEGLSTDSENKYSGARGFEICHSMYFGLIQNTAKVMEMVTALQAGPTFLHTETWDEKDGRQLAVAPATEAQLKLLDTAALWAADFAEVGKLVALLDSRRPIPTIVCKTLSPTVAANVGKAMGIDLTTIESPPVKYIYEERTIKGQKVQVPVGIEILWPEGTLHGKSRFTSGTAHNDQCHACGHAIKDPFNWLPLVARGADNVPKSLWTGRDCAKKLLGCEVSGEAEYKR